MWWVTVGPSTGPDACRRNSHFRTCGSVLRAGTFLSSCFLNHFFPTLTQIQGESLALQRGNESDVIYNKPPDIAHL